MTLESQNVIAQLQIARSLTAQALAAQDALLAAFASPIAAVTPPVTTQAVQTLPSVPNTETSQLLPDGPQADGQATPLP